MIDKMYRKARLLNKETDKNLTISAVNHYKHARTINAIPVAVNEIPEVCKYYPIFFVKDSEGAIPFAVLSIKDNDNNFVNNSGEWRKNKYIPALIRSYPFVLSKTDKDNTFSIAIDEEYEGLNQKDGQRIFDDEGNFSKYGQDINKFLSEIYTSLETTKKMGKLLLDYDLLKQVDANVSGPDGAKYVLRGVTQIDSEKLNKLDDETLLKLVKTGVFGNLVTPHLISLTTSNFNNLF